MIWLLAPAIALAALRGYAEFIVSGDLFGWVLPSWYSRRRDPVAPGWMFWRDPFHTWQFVRNRAGNAAVVLGYVALQTAYGPLWGAVAAETVWIIGHGIGFSLTLRMRHG